MSNGANDNTNFGRQDGVDLKTYFNDRIEGLLSLINEKDKNYNQRFENVIQATQAALAAADRAVNKAEEATEKRFASVNEFRQTLTDQTSTFLTRAEFNAKWENVEKSRKDNTSLIMAILGIIISVVSLVIKFL